jgi:hypothetical protein
MVRLCRIAHKTDSCSTRRQVLDAFRALAQQPAGTTRLVAEVSAWQESKTMQPPQHDPDPRRLDDLFSRTIDASPVRFVRPCDTDRPAWAAYENARYLGTLHAQRVYGPRR